MNTTCGSISAKSRRRQRGATALEFGLVFPALFILFYGTLSFALIFTVRMGLQHAAEEGARSAVTFRVAEVAEPVEGEAPLPPPTQLELRRAAAERTARVQAGWISRWADVDVKAFTCPATDRACTTSTDICGKDFATACNIRVTVRYPDYSGSPILPTAFGLPVPDSLSGEASLLLDARMLGS